MRPPGAGAPPPAMPSSAAPQKQTWILLSAHAGNTPHPILFLAGACDTWIGPELQARHAALFPHAKLVVIPDAGHDMFWDNPEAALPVVRAFLAEQ